MSLFQVPGVSHSLYNWTPNVFYLMIALTSKQVRMVSHWWKKSSILHTNLNIRIVWGINT